MMHSRLASPLRISLAVMMPVEQVRLQKEIRKIWCVPFATQRVETEGMSRSEYH